MTGQVDPKTAPWVNGVIEIVWPLKGVEVTDDNHTKIERVADDMDLLMDGIQKLFAEAGLAAPVFMGRWEDSLGDEPERVLLKAKSVTEDRCICEGDPPLYRYRRDERLHCSWCDGLAKEEQQ